jgi:signal transduction histidine kinase
VVDDRSGGRLAQADRRALADVVIELLRNARTAIVGTGRDHGRIVISVEVDGDDLALRLADDGPGMDAATAAAALEPFTGSSSGLGLAIARRTMEAMGGSLAIDSRPGAGTCVILGLRGAAGA